MLDLERYAGKYYEIYVQNAPFEFGCMAATAEYLATPEGLSIVNKCYSENGTGEIYTEKQPNLKVVRQIKGIATPTESPNVFNVTFETGNTGLYRIFYANYMYSIIGDLDTNYLSIISKIPYPNPIALENLLVKAESFGFTVS